MFLFVAESAKDALAHHAIHNSRDILYCSVGGNLSSGQMETINAVARKMGLVRVLGFDNDIPGNLFVLRYVLHDLNPMNTARHNQKNGTVSLSLVDTDGSGIHNSILKFFGDRKNRHIPTSPIKAGSGILSFSVSAEMDTTTDLIYTILKANRKLFEGKLMLQRPKEKDFYDCFIKKLNTYQRPRNRGRNNP